MQHLAFVLSGVAIASATLPDFPTSWSVHEDQVARVTGSRLTWHGTVYNDPTSVSLSTCTPPTTTKQRNCSATAYVDDSGHKSTYHLFEPGQSIRGLTYFVQDKNIRNDACYCDMAAEGRWIQCEIAESLCNPFMLKHGQVTGQAQFKGKPVDVIQWSESLIIASTKFRIYVEANSSTPAQYYTEFFEGKRALGYNEVNMSAFTPGRPDSSVFAFNGRVSGMCADRVCSTYAKARQAGAHPIAAYPAWK